MLVKYFGSVDIEYNNLLFVDVGLFYCVMLESWWGILISPPFTVAHPL